MTTTSSRSSYFSRNWFWVLVSISGVYVILPFLAPIFMTLGWNGLGRVIYFIYSFLCHQLPQRSYFLFGQHFTYSLAQIQQVTGISDPNNFFALRSFIGNPEMGWKVAWSDRMISMFTSIPLFALLWYPFRRRIKAIPWWVFVLMTLPVALDGTTHLISDIHGIGQGFRDTNLWLSALTKGVFSPVFYAGDAWGSFNSIARLSSGFLFGLGIVWFGFPYLEEEF